MLNPSRFRVARKRRRLNKTQLAEMIGVDLRMISSYESGEYSPSPETMTKIENALEFPKKFFSGADVHEPSQETASFRSAARMSATTREAALSSGALSMLLNSYIESRFSLPSCDVPDLRGEDPETAANALRQQWNLGQRPIKNMIHLVEAKGVRVFSMAEDTVEINAFSLWAESTPFIFLNTCKSAESSRFDAAHELGHLVLHQDTVPQGKACEQEADKFASAFLMPRSSVLAYGPIPPNLQMLIKLKHFWIVSVAALAYRLHAIGIFKDWHYRQLFIEMSKHGYRKFEPDGAQREMSAILEQVFKSLKADDIGKIKIADDLGLPARELEKLVFGLIITSLSGEGLRHASVRRPSLQLVK